MILTKTVIIRPNSKTLKYYKNLGYDCVIHSKIEIPVEHLTKGSHQILNVKCDFCGKEKKLDYNSYWRNTDHLTIPYACCEKCGMKKRDTTNLKIYGTKNVFENEKIKEKIKKTYKRNLGVDHPSKSKEIQDKTKSKIIEKFGKSNYNNKAKREETNLEKYGVKNSFQNKKSYDTKKYKIIERYKDRGLIDIKDKRYIIECDKGHKCEIEKSIFFNRIKLKTVLCTMCNPVGDCHRSGLENIFSEFISKIYKGNVINNKKFSYQEIDVYLPELKIGFDYNGVYWHNELYKQNYYHQEKTEFFDKMNIKLIQIYEDDWNYKQNIVKSRILNLLGKSERIMARKCETKEIEDNDLIKNFLENNHLQGFIGSNIKIGLFYNNELVSLMTFGNLRKAMGQKSSEGSYEMLRFCNKLNTNIVGGASKIFKYFIEKYKPKEIISYADRNWSSGDLYKKLGFKLENKTKPNYYYVIDGIKKHRFGFRKDILVKQGFDQNKTEHDIMLERKIFRIYDSGNLKFKFISD
jgi:hypothetical protein